MSEWSVERVLGLAPDASSVQAARKLASPARWSAPARDDRALWGELQGSGKKAYQTRVDLAGPAAKCSCPSRKFPCKHALALLLVLAESPHSVARGTPPDWVAEWIAGRDARNERPAAGKGTKAPDPVAREQRRAQREERIAAGLDELERWLLDVVAQGVAHVADLPATANRMAARMVDSQAPGLEAPLRALAHAHGDALADALGQVWLLASAYRRVETLPAELAASVRSRIGWAQRTEDVLAGPRVRDTWYVLGSDSRREGRIEAHRTLAWGAASGRPALFLEFAALGAAPTPPAAPGQCLDADLVFHDGAFPWRAIVAQLHGAPEWIAGLPATMGDASVAAALDRHAAAVAADPWTDESPLLLRGVRLCVADGQVHVADTVGATLAVGTLGDHATGIDALLAVAEEERVDIAGTLTGTGVHVTAVVTTRGVFVPSVALPTLFVGAGS